MQGLDHQLLQGLALRLLSFMMTCFWALLVTICRPHTAWCFCMYVLMASGVSCTIRRRCCKNRSSTLQSGAAIYFASSGLDLHPAGVEGWLVRREQRYVVFVRRLHTHPGDHGLALWALQCHAASQSKRWACAHFLAFDAAMWFGGFCQLCGWLRRFARCSLRERDRFSLPDSSGLVWSEQADTFLEGGKTATRWAQKQVINRTPLWSIGLGFLSIWKTAKKMSWRPRIAVVLRRWDISTCRKNSCEATYGAEAMSSAGYSCHCADGWKCCGYEVLFFPRTCRSIPPIYGASKDRSWRVRRSLLEFVWLEDYGI